MVLGEAQLESNPNCSVKGTLAWFVHIFSASSIYTAISGVVSFLQTPRECASHQRVAIQELFGHEARNSLSSIFWQCHPSHCILQV